MRCKNLHSSGKPEEFRCWREGDSAEIVVSWRSVFLFRRETWFSFKTLLLWNEQSPLSIIFSLAEPQYLIDHTTRGAPLVLISHSSLRYPSICNKFIATFRHFRLQLEYCVQSALIKLNEMVGGVGNRKYGID